MVNLSFGGCLSPFFPILMVSLFFNAKMFQVIYKLRVNTGELSVYEQNSC